MPIEFAPPSAQVQPFQIAPAQYTDPLETLSRMQQMRTQNIQQQQAQLGLQQTQMQMDSQKAMLRAVVDGGNDPDKTFQLMGQYGVLPSDQLAYQQHVYTLAAQKATWQKDQQQIFEKDSDIASGAYKRVAQMDNPTQDDLNAANTELDKIGVSPRVHRVTVWPGDKDHMMALANSIGAAGQIDERTLKGAQTSKEQAQTEQAQATTQEAQQKITAGEKAATVTDILGAEKDQNGLPVPAAWVAIRQAHPKMNLPDIPNQTFINDLVRGQVAPKDLPEFDIKAKQAQAMSSMKPGDWDSYVDSVIPPGGDTAALNLRTKAQVRGAIASGSPMTTVQGIVKDASDQIGRTETGVRTAKATAPVKVEVAAATAQAKADAAGLTEDDYARLGEQLARTGAMPSAGRDSITRGKILHASNEWARDNGLSPADLVTMQAAYAGDKASLKEFQAKRDQIVSFEQTAQKNLDLFLAQAGKIPDTGIPWLNRPLRELNQSIVGSENIAAVNAARQVANNEIAKVTSGGGLSGVLSDSARNEVAGYNPANATFAQTKAVAAILKADMANRHQSMDATLSDIKSRIGGQTQPTAPGVVKVGKNATGGDIYREAPRVTTKAQRDALPSGTLYIGPDGKQYRKQ